MHKCKNKIIIKFIKINKQKIKVFFLSTNLMIDILFIYSLSCFKQNTEKIYNLKALSSNIRMF